MKHLSPNDLLVYILRVHLGQLALKENPAHRERSARKEQLVRKGHRARERRV